jgi:hypothetical protein
MSDGKTAVPPVQVDEWLARFIHYRRYIRQDLTVRPDAFIPHPYRDLSVTRHLHLSDSEIWEIARTVARQTEKALHGRVDVEAAVFLRQELQVIAAPILPENPNHANVTGWPAEKSAQKIIAQQIASTAGNALAPPPNTA